MNPENGTFVVTPELTIRFGIAVVTPEVTFQIEEPPKRFPWHKVRHFLRETLIWTAFGLFIFANAVISANNPHVNTRVITVPIIIHR